MKVLFPLTLAATALVGVVLLVGCASRPQTCAPKDTRCQILVIISKETTK